MSIKYLNYIESCLNNGLSPAESVLHLIDIYNLKHKSVIKKAYLYAYQEYYKPSKNILHTGRK